VDAAILKHCCNSNHCCNSEALLQRETIAVIPVYGCQISRQLSELLQSRAEPSNRNSLRSKFAGGKKRLKKQSKLLIRVWGGHLG
jgi:hypothetical protein